MPRRPHQPDLDLSSGERLGELLAGHAAASVGRNGQAMAPAVTTPHRPHIVETLRRRLGGAIAENTNLAARVGGLEAELRRSSAELARLRGQLRGALHDALSDPLTGLANRRAFDLELRTVAARASSSSPAHLVLADIDHFKQVNDTHGHAIGDEVLRIVGAVLLASVRCEALVARLGGDEFGLVLPRAGAHHAAAVATRLCARLASHPLVVGGVPEGLERITLSIGVAGWRGDESDAEWCARADAALYRAKRRGRSRVALDARRFQGVAGA